MSFSEEFDRICVFGSNVEVEVLDAHGVILAE
jgi:hypothetical protein